MGPFGMALAPEASAPAKMVVCMLAPAPGVAASAVVHLTTLSRLAVPRAGGLLLRGAGVS